MTHLLEPLNLPDDTPVALLSLDMQRWGWGLLFLCEARPIEGDSVAFTLALTDCREMRWQVYSHQHGDDALALPPTTLVSYRLGRSQHRSPAHFLTEHFALSVFYGGMRINLR